MSEPIISCKNCGNQFTGKYCNNCGEKVYTVHDKSVLHFFEEAFHFITHFEGTFFNTLKTIFSKPGKLSLDYCNGLRKKYFKPLPFFMLLVVLYLIFPIFTGLNMPFKYYLSKDTYASRVTTKKTGFNIDSILTTINIAVEARNFKSKNEANIYWIKYADSIAKSLPELTRVEATFNKKSEKTSKLLLLILLPLTAIVLSLLSIRKRRYFFDQLVLSTEINSFYLLFSFFIMPLLITICYKLFPQTAQQVLTDSSIGFFSYTVIGFFSAIAFRQFYNDRRWWSVIKAIFVIFAHYFIVHLIYKFILFAFTFYLST
ncbi:MAG: DUF3667 domain-containing protein [Ferruginibacter sp.]|nr:DUF3667 domain-containing protein [Ferruginibacter sp.]